MHYLSIVCIVRNEEKYISEFLDFHIKQGVDHFHIYDNNSTDDTISVLKPYMKTGLVRLHLWSDVPGQFTAYNDALRYMESWSYEDSEWVAFIDADEFLWSPKYPQVKTALKHLDLKYGPRVSAIAVHWMLFGSNGHEEYSDELVTKRFTKRAKAPDQHVKTIVRRRMATSVGKNPHTFMVSRGSIIDENGANLPVEYALLPGGTAEIIRLNHMHTKSKGEYFERKRNNPDCGSGRPYSEDRILEMFNAHDVSETDDYSLIHYLDK